MFTTFQNIHEEFMRVFLPSISVPTGVGQQLFSVYYAREGNKDYKQIHKEKNPQIIISDYIPETDTDWNDSFQLWYGSFSESSPISGYDKALEYKEPLRFLFKYDVTAYVYNAYDKWLISNYFNSKFRQKGFFTFNKVSLSVPNFNTELGDKVSYTMLTTENTRTDGVHEINFEFSFKAMLNISEGVEVDLLRKIFLNNNQIIP